MRNKFFISDHHLGHEGILTFKNYNGSNVRDFKNLDAMHEYIIKQHNSVVGEYDKVYFLGDVCINSKYLHLLNEMNGKKRLIMGNHDIFNKRQQVKTSNGVVYYNAYDQYFEEVLAYKVFPDNFICSHIPLSRQSISDRFCYNVHGHLHNNTVKKDNGNDDELYYNVSCERLDFKPIEFGELKQILDSPFRGDEYYMDYELSIFER